MHTFCIFNCIHPVYGYRVHALENEQPSNRNSTKVLSSYIICELLIAHNLWIRPREHHPTPCQNFGWLDLSQAMCGQGTVRSLVLQSCSLQERAFNCTPHLLVSAVSALLLPRLRSLGRTRKVVVRSVLFRNEVSFSSWHMFPSEESHNIETLINVQDVHWGRAQNFVRKVCGKAMPFYFFVSSDKLKTKTNSISLDPFNISLMNK